MNSTTSLRLVAILFILAGIGSALGMASSLFNGAASISTGLLSLFIGIGLLRHRSGWRSVALIAIWFTLAVSCVAGIVVISVEAIPVNVFGTLVASTAGRVMVTAGIALLAAMYIWMYRVLVRNDVKAIFEQGSPTMHSNNDAPKDGARFS